MRTTPITGNVLGDLEVTGNHFTSSDPWKLGGQGDHADMIHLYNRSDFTEPVDNIVISDNFFEQGTGEDAILGIYLAEAYGIKYTNVVIENNVIHNGDAQGIRLENVDGGIVANNTLLPTTDEYGTKPGIVLKDDSKNLVIENNIVGSISGESWDAASGQNIVSSGNLLVQNNDPFAENYIGDLFANGLTTNGDIWDFAVIPGSAADGIGAASTQAGVTHAEPYALISDTVGRGMDIQTHVLSVESLIAPNGAIDLSGATVTWDLGDGSSASGMSISHDFGASGSYEVKALIETPGGESYTVDRTVLVQTLEALDADFEGTLADLSDLENPATLYGTASYVNSDYGQAISLGSEASYIEYEKSLELLDNPEYSISMSFKKDLATDEGKLLYFSGSSYLTVGEDHLSFAGITSTGESVSLSSAGIGVNDTDWHHITVTFSGTDGTAKLFLDGEKIDEDEGITGIQTQTRGHDLNIGGLFGGSFTGLIDNFDFVRGAMTGADVAEQHGILMGTVVPNPDPEPEEPEVEPPAPEPEDPETPVGEDPTQEEPAPEEPEEETPVEEEPIIVGEEPPVVEDPVVEESPVLEDPTVEELVVEDPVVEDPVVEDPVVEDPVVEASGVSRSANRNYNSKSDKEDDDDGFFLLKMLKKLFGFKSNDDVPDQFVEAFSDGSGNLLTSMSRGARQEVLLSDIVPEAGEESVPEDDDLDIAA